ncbi:MAG: translation initiation factor IF-2 N-terminal domain-containing protein, partial [Candidatus Desulfatibia sp.]|uniref:translation initiation factor IF-2 N-terminal domain-containing protein n=1 Tax=Candidatus Desulfatibia sp. TaxID=3101189 RepID=UPI002F2C3A49
MRIYELAKKIGAESADIIAELKTMGIKGKTASSTVDAKAVTAITGKLAGKPAGKLDAKAKTAPSKKTAKTKKSAKTAPTEAKKKKAKAAPAVKETVKTEKTETVPEEKEKEKEKKIEELKRAEEEERKKKKEEELKKEEEEAKQKKKEEQELQKLIEEEDREKKEEEEDREKKEEESKKLAIDDAITVKDFAENLNAPVAEIIKRLFVKGTAVTVNQILGVKLATDLANEMGYTVTVQEAV